MKRAFLLVMVLLAAARPPAAEMTLSKKAAVFQHDMESRFLLEGQALCKLKLPDASRDFVDYNMPDNAYMTGMYLGALCMKYEVTQAPEDKAKALASLSALDHLCTASGIPGLWARAFWPVDKPLADDGGWRPTKDGKYRWRGDVSTDQVDGVLFGFSWAYDTVAGEEERALIRKHVTEFVEYVLKNDLRIVGFDGKPTQWGKYYKDYVQKWEHQNALLWLQALKIAAHVANDPRYEELYRTWALDNGYVETALKARRNLDPASNRVNHSDDVLLFLAYEPLLRLETDPEIRTFYEKSLARSWNGSDGFPGVKPEANPFFTFVAAKYLGDESVNAAARETLAFFPFDLKWNRDTIARYAAEFNFESDFTPHSTPPKPGEPVPIDRREKSWSAFVMNPYGPVAESRVEKSPMEFNGHDYLLGYWIGRYFGYIPADE